MWQTKQSNQGLRTRTYPSKKQWRLFLRSLGAEYSSINLPKKSKILSRKRSIFASVVMVILTACLWTLFVGGLMLTFFIPNSSAAAEIIDVNRTVNAIYLAEGGAKADYPYGIRSEHCTSETSCREICERTVLRNINRWLARGGKGDFIEFLGGRYAPANASNDPHGLNKHWIKNVRYFLIKGVSA